jgi:hypothetical protein
LGFEGRKVLGVIFNGMGWDGMGLGKQPGKVVQGKGVNVYNSRWGVG